MGRLEQSGREEKEEGRGRGTERREIGEERGGWKINKSGGGESMSKKRRKKWTAGGGSQVRYGKERRKGTGNGSRKGKNMMCECERKEEILGVKGQRGGKK